MPKIKKLLFRSDTRREKIQIKFFLTHQLKSLAITDLGEYVADLKCGKILI